MKVAVSTLVHGRHEVLRKFFTVGELFQIADICFIAYTDDKDREFIESLELDIDLRFVQVDNDPLWAKANAPIQLARKYKDWDALMLVGSDDLIYQADRYVNYLKEGYDYVCVEDCMIYDAQSGIARYWGQYTNFRAGEPAGAGRCLHRSLLQRMNWTVYGDGSMDYVAHERAMAADANMMKMVYDALLIDIKTEDSVSPFSMFKSLPKVEVPEALKEDLFFEGLTEVNEQS